MGTYYFYNVQSILDGLVNTIGYKTSHFIILLTLVCIQFCMASVYNQNIIHTFYHIINTTTNTSYIDNFFFLLIFSLFFFLLYSGRCGAKTHFKSGQTYLLDGTYG